MSKLNITRPQTEEADISEKGKNKAGETISLNRRLFMQLLVFTKCNRIAPLLDQVRESNVQAVIYEELNDPEGIGLLTFSEDPSYFLTAVRPLVNTGLFDSLTPKREMTMIGRTYSIGYEQDLEYTLINKPISRVTDPNLPWAIFYPLRRSGKFEQITAAEQRTILMEHGGIGRAYASKEYGFDIRLACHGLDKNDNDFITGLVGKELYPLSHIVQRMRKTTQTSQYLESLGPFFVGKAVYQWKGQ